MKTAAIINAQLKTILAPVAAELALVEADLYGSILPPSRDIHEPFLYLDTMKGKLLRPALVFLTSQYFKKTTDLHRSLARCVELVHVASLTHDDVVDHSPLRRGKPSLNARFGDESALLVGDYLFSKALELLVGFRSPDVFVKVARVISTASVGELRQIGRSFDLSLSEDDYLQYIEAKTAGLFAAATELSAIASGAKPDSCAQMGVFGLNFGMAFQIADDCSDLFGDTVVEGKPVRSDLVEGQFTLPILRLFRKLGSEWSSNWLGALRNDPLSAEWELKHNLAKEGILEYCVERASKYVDAANDALSRIGVRGSDSSLPALGDMLVKKMQSLK